MISDNKIWMTAENEKELEQLQDIFNQHKDEYQRLFIFYKELKPFLTFDYIQIGKYKDFYELSGILYINERAYKLDGFKAEVTLNVKYFKQLFKKLTENTKIKSHEPIIIVFGKDLPVFIQIKNKIGVIAPMIEGEY